MMRKSRLFSIGIVGALWVWANGAAAAPRLGLSVGPSVGVMVPSDADADVEAAAAFQLVCDVYGFDVGFSAGYFNRADTYTYSRTSNHHTYYYENEYEQAFYPVQLNLRILPVRFFRQSFVFQPYLGIGLGALLPDTSSGDDNAHEEERDVYAMASPQVGFEFQLSRWAVLSLDLAYNVVLDEEDDGNSYYTGEDYDLDYFTAMLAVRFRGPFTNTK